ncbi:MAG: CHAT domain-containing protein [Flavobacteriaceae bacterium]|nr:CHAT domain-containing protein [Bacteroidia bacterium]NNK82421.1 CHAT domain-containing protein [Flavobacteriaceae bacterium]
MRKIALYISIIFLPFLLFAQETNENDKVTSEIKSLIRQHEEDIRDLYNVRSAPQEWIKTDQIDEKILFNVVDRYYRNFNKNVAVIVYTYINDSLQLNLFGKQHKFEELKTQIEKNKLQELIHDVNYLYSSKFSNRAPSLRGSQAKDISANFKELKTSFSELNTILLPEELNLKSVDHIIIVPTFNIATLPFSAFKIGDSYLIDNMSYSIAPNLFELLYSNDKNRVKQGDYYREIEYTWFNALFVANPNYPKNLEWEFPDLPGAEHEVDYVIEKVKPLKFNKLYGKDATKEEVLKNICEYDLLYFATHGISNSKSPMDHSFIVLADNGTEKSYLSLREIMNTRKTCKLKADLVVLSACQTGLGMSHRGGIIGLARAFQIAGANHVLMSLWNINDTETATLMQYFFNELEIAKTLMPHEALRNAILKYKAEVNDDPKYWAAFSIFGVPY